MFYPKTRLTFFSLAIHFARADVIINVIMLAPIPDHPPPKYQPHPETPPALPARPKRLELESRSTFSRSTNHHPSQKTHRSEQNSGEASTPSLVQTPRVQRYFSSPLSPHLLLPDFTPPGRQPKIQRKRHDQFSPVPHMTSDPSSYSVATTMTVSYKRSETDSSFTDSLLESQHQGLSQLADLRLGSVPIREIQSPPLPKRKNIHRTVEISHQGGSSECSSNLTSRFERRKQIAKYVRVLWLGLSVTITSVSIFSYIQPHWFVSQTTATSLGVFGYCEPNRLKSARNGEGFGSRWKHYVEPDDVMNGDWRFHRSNSGHNVPRVCALYGGRAGLSNLPSNIWQVGCVMFGGGCALLLVSSVSALLCFMLTLVEALRQRISVGRLCTHTAYVQVMSGWITGFLTITITTVINQH